MMKRYTLGLILTILTLNTWLSANTDSRSLIVYENELAAEHHNRKGSFAARVFGSFKKQVETQMMAFSMMPSGELEFCVYNIDIYYGETFNIRDFVHVKDNPNEPIDWSEVYFTYTAVGANDPTTPTNWKLEEYNNGTNVTVTAADAASGTGNSGDGQYRVYLVRNGETDYDDHAEVRIHDDPGDSDYMDNMCEDNNSWLCASSQVSASTDDAEERLSDNHVDLVSSDLELINDPSDGDQEVGMRFTGVNIPQGATITRAYIEFEVDEVDFAAANLVFYGEDIDDAVTFDNSTNKIANRTKTSNSVDWNPVDTWPTTDIQHRSPDLSAIVQEIVDRSGWSSGNDMAFIVTGSGERTAESYDGEPAAAPRLVVCYAPLPFNCSGGLLTNPDFESGSTGWTLQSNTTITTSDSYFGGQSAHASGGTGGPSQEVAANADEIYSLEVYAKHIGSESSIIGIKFLDASFTELSASYLDITSTSWDVYYLAAKAPANTAYVQALGWKNTGAGESFWDGFCLQLWNVTAPTCNNTSCDLSPSYNNYIWAIDDAGNDDNWREYDYADLILCDNGDGTLGIKGNIINGRDASWGNATAPACGSQDGWYVDLTLSDMQSWSEFQGSYEVSASCPNAYLDLDYWNVVGTYTGIGCNTGRTMTVNGPSTGYRLQIGSGGNPHSCNFGISTWFDTDEGGSPVKSDIYAHIDSLCYYSMRPDDCTTIGYADAVTSQTGVDNSTNALNAPDGAYAQVYDPTDVITLDLIDEIPTGDTYTITWRRKPAYTNTAIANIVIEESSDGVNFTTNAFVPGTSDRVNFVNTDVTAGVNTRYIRMMEETGTDDDFDLDAISYTVPCNQVEICGNGIDDDGDTLVDENDPDCALNTDVCYIISDGENSGGSTPDTLHTINPETGVVTAVGPTGTMVIEAMAIDTVNSVIYAMTHDTLMTVNPSAGTASYIGEAGLVDINGAEGLLDVDDVDGLTYDYTNQILWASVRRTGEGGDDFLPDDLLVQINPSDGTVIEDAFGTNVDYVVISTPEDDIDDLAMASDGTLYAISNRGATGNQMLGTVNKTTGAFTAIGDHGIHDVESLTFAGTGQLIATTGDDGNHKNNFYSIDPTTAEAIYVAPLITAFDVEACACGNQSTFVNTVIAGKVWADLDEDGIQDIEEPGVKKVTVNLLDNSGNPILDGNSNAITTKTDNVGLYEFNRLPAGDYIVEFVAPSGASFTLKDQGGDDTLDSDANTGNGRTDAFNTIVGKYNKNIDAGLQDAAVIVRTCADDGNLLVIEESGYVVRFDGDTGTLLDTFIYNLNTPRDLVISPDEYLYVSDEDNHAIYKFSLVTGALMQTFTDQLSKPNGMVFDDNGYLYVNNRGDDNVLRFDPNNSSTATVFVATQAQGLDGNRGGIVFGADGNLYVASRYSHTILRFNGTTGAYIDDFVAAGAGGLSNPLDINFGPDGNLYVTSSNTDDVRRYNGSTGAFIDIFVASGSGGLDNPYKFQFGEDGNLYVSDQDGPLEVLSFNGSTGAYIETFTSGMDMPQGLLFAPVPGCVCSVPGDLIVTSTGDEGDTNPGDGVCKTVNCDCTLRAAIEEANALAGVDTIKFDIAGTGPHTITPMSDYPYITEGVVIDAYTQSGTVAATAGTAATLQIQIDGSNLTNGWGVLHTTAGGSTFKGLVINGHTATIASCAITLQSDNNYILGCHIGTNVAGDAAIANSRAIRIFGTNNNTIGGSDPADRNIISGSTYNGLALEINGSLKPDNNHIEGNYIGTNATGTAGLGNGYNGIDNAASTNTTIINNLIAANGSDGIEIDGQHATSLANNVVVQGNIIGTDITQTLDLGNAARGIFLWYATNTTIGGLNNGEENIIVNNDGAGIEIIREESDNNNILRNSIYNNDGIGIDLAVGFGGDGVTPNDANDTDTGANDFLNYPEINELELDGVNINYDFDLDVPAGDYRIEWFKNSTIDPTGYGEGEVFVGTLQVNHAGGGTTNFTGTFSPSPTVADGDSITMTITLCTDGTCTAFNGTSEFSGYAVAKSCDNVTNAGTISGDESNCGSFDPAIITETTAASGGTGILEYQWQSSTDANIWTDISGATAATYDPTTITQTTYYKRKARRNGCDDSDWLYSNIIEKEVVTGNDQYHIVDAFNGTGQVTLTQTSLNMDFVPSSQRRIVRLQVDFENTSSEILHDVKWVIPYGYYQLNGNANLQPYDWDNDSDQWFSSNHNGDDDAGVDADIPNTSDAGTFTPQPPAAGRIVLEKTNIPLSQLYNGGTATGTSSDRVPYFQVDDLMNPGETHSMTFFFDQERKTSSPEITGYWIYTYTVAVQPTTIQADETQCQSYDPAEITPVYAGNTGALLFQWQSNDGSTGWNDIVGATNETYDPTSITQTMQYRRGSRQNVCAAWDYSNIVTKTVLDNYTGAGSITGDEEACGSFDPTTITEVSSPSGSTEPLEYQWQSSLDGSTWSDIAGANAATYDPTTITATTYYQRGVRRQGCQANDWIYSNSVIKQIIGSFTDPGSISGDEGNCGSFDPAEITATTAPSGGTGGSTKYQWQSSPDGSTWSDIAGATAESYNPPTINQTTHYQRGTRRANCDAYLYSNTVVKTVETIFANGGTISGDESNCIDYTPSLIDNVSDASGGIGSIQYSWASSTDNVNWTPIAGANQATYQPGLITQTTYFQRLAQTNFCSNPVASNVVTKEKTNPLFCLESGEWSYDCLDGVCAEIEGIGNKGATSAALGIEDSSTVQFIVVEATFSGGSGSPNEVTFSSSNGESVVAQKIYFEGESGSSGDRYFQAEMTTADSVFLDYASSAANRAESFVAYIFRDCQDNGSYGRFVHAKLSGGDADTTTFAIPTGNEARDILVEVPLSELTNDGRIVNVHASAGGVSKTISVNNYNQGNSLNITPFTLENVPDTATSVTIIVESPPGGQSLYLSGAVGARLDCAARLAIRPTTDEACAEVGDTIHYNYKIYNYGDNTINSISASDEKVGAISLSTTTLASGDSLIAYGTYIVQASDLPGPLTNTATVSGTDAVTSETISDVFTVAVPLTAASFSITANRTDAIVGDTITYTYNIANTGSSALQIDVTDSIFGNALSNRVVDALQVLYTFDEGAGNTIYDVSGIGDALDLTIETPANTTWGQSFITVNSETRATNVTLNNKVYTSCQASNELSLEVWVKPANNSQGGPARMLGFSLDSGERNFQLCQENNDYTGRLRTTGHGTNELDGTGNHINNGTVWQHVVYTYDGTDARLYVDGVEISTAGQDNPTGDFSNWSDSHAIILFNEYLDSRDWLGDMGLAAIYSKALSLAEITQNYNTGYEDVIGYLGIGDTLTFTQTYIVQNSDFPSPLTNVATLTATAIEGCALNIIDSVQVILCTNRDCIELCDDGIDNDGDGLTDCDDPDCGTLTDGGWIEGAEKDCGSYDPTIITNDTLPGNHGGNTLLYEWEQSTDFGNNWFIVSGANSESFDPPTISITTQYRRKSRLYSCNAWQISNAITKKVVGTPTANADIFDSCPGVEFSDNVGVNDLAIDNPTYSITENPSQGAVSIDSTGKFTYTPSGVNCAVDQFSYQVCNDETSCCSIAIVTINLADSEAPTLMNVPDDLTLDCDATIPVLPLVLAIDNCPAISISVDETSTQTYSGCNRYSYEITRVWTAADFCGNMVRDTQIIVVQDTIAPTFTVPNTASLGCLENKDSLSITGDVTDEYDICDSDVEATYIDDLTALNLAECRGFIIRTWAASDDCGNTTVATQIISVYADDDRDKDGTPDIRDHDDDNDGIPDVDETYNDTDSDGITNNLDLDSDNDGIPDIIEAGFIDSNGDGVVDNLGLPGWDDDGDGFADGFDANDMDTSLVASDNFEPLTPIRDKDGDGVTNFWDLDSDNDGVGDLIETGGVDVNGDGIIDYPTISDPTSMIDADQDGFADVYDPDDDGNPGVEDPGDPLMIYNGIEYIDGTTNVNHDSDGDDIPNLYDLDCDNDGISDLIEAMAIDTDGDGRIDMGGEFEDTNGDGFHDNYSALSLMTTDPDGATVDGRPEDDDGDGTPYNGCDLDKDGIPNQLDLEADGDGINDIIEIGNAAGDLDNDGRVDSYTDGNKDGFDDTLQGMGFITTDDDGSTDDGRPEDDSDSNFSPYSSSAPDGTMGETNGESDIDDDADGTLNFLDIDSDNDLLPDYIEDPNGNGIQDPGETKCYHSDSDGDGIKDGIEDENKNGSYEITETDPLNPNTDGDPLDDGAEDTNFNGVVDFTESDPRDPCDPFLNESCLGVKLNVRIKLQGAMMGNTDTLMRDDLRAKGLIPLVEPYLEMDGFSHFGLGGIEVIDTSVLIVQGTDAIVDWVMVELRDPNDPKTVLSTRSGLLQRDGDIVDLDGVSPVWFPVMPSGDYYVSARHRNHLGVMTYSTHTLSPTPVTIDFTVTTTLTHGGLEAQKEKANRNQMWAGDINSDGRVIYQGPQNDIFNMLFAVLFDTGNGNFLANYISYGYANSDLNMDGMTIYQGPNNDRGKVLLDIILQHPDNGGYLANYIVWQKIPE